VIIHTADLKNFHSAAHTGLLLFDLIVKRFDFLFRNDPSFTNAWFISIRRIKKKFGVHKLHTPNKLTIPPKTKLIVDHYYFISIFAILRNWLIISVIIYHILLTVHIFFNCSLRQLGYRCTFRRSHYFE